MREWVKQAERDAGTLETPRLFRLKASVGELTTRSALEILSPGDSEFLIGRCPGPDHPTLLSRRYWCPNQAAFPDTARLLPVMVLALAHASRSSGAAGQLIIRAWRTTAYTVPAEAG